VRLADGTYKSMQHNAAHETRVFVFIVNSQSCSEVAQRSSGREGGMALIRGEESLACQVLEGGEGDGIPVITGAESSESTQMEGVHVVGVHLESLRKVLLGFH